MRNIYEQHSIHHILFCPKRWRKVLIGPVHDCLMQIFEEVALEHEWKIERLAIQPDHVHLFIQSNPYATPIDIARLMKGRSSHLLREEFPHLMRMPSLWTRSTFYSTAGHVSQDSIDRYIERQSKSKGKAGMLIYEYKLDGNKAQYAAIDEAIRIVQFIRNKCLRL